MKTHRSLARTRRPHSGNPEAAVVAEPKEAVEESRKGNDPRPNVPADANAKKPALTMPRDARLFPKNT